MRVFFVRSDGVRVGNAEDSPGWRLSFCSAGIFASDVGARFASTCLFIYLRFGKLKKKRYKGENSSDQGQIDGHPLSSYRSCSFAARFCFSSPPPRVYVSSRSPASKRARVSPSRNVGVHPSSWVSCFISVFVCPVLQHPALTWTYVFSALIPADSVFRFPLSAYEDGHLRVPIG